DSFRKHRVHDAPRRIHELFRPGGRGLRVQLPPELGDVGGALLAAGLRRDAGGHRDLRAGRARGSRVPSAAGLAGARMILQATGLTNLYGEFCALDGVSLGVAAGEFVSIVGPNGAGKSTLINILTGVTRPSAGNVRFKDRDVGGAGPVRLARLGMARSFQLVQVFPDLTVLETLQAAVVARLGRGTRLLASLAADHEVRERAREVAELFGLGDKRHARAKHLPQGDKKLLD